MTISEPQVLTEKEFITRRLQLRDEVKKILGDEYKPTSEEVLLDIIERLQTNYNEAIAVMQAVHEYADHGGIHKHTNRVTLLETIRGISGRFLAKHKEATP